MSRAEYALETFLESLDGFSGGFRRGRAICSDGRVRTLKRISPFADTFFSVPAAVEVKGKTVTGFVTVESLEGSQVPTDDDPAVVKFRAYSYGKNADVLPAGSYRTRYLETLEGGTRYLTRDGNFRVPCSRYGFDSKTCAPVAFIVALIVSRESGEPLTEESLDWAMGLVVNDHEDPETLIRDYGREYGFSPSRYLD